MLININALHVIRDDMPVGPSYFSTKSPDFYLLFKVRAGIL